MIIDSVHGRVHRHRSRKIFPGCRPPHAAPATPSSPVSLRVYGPEDYHVRLRRYFEEKGSLRLPVPGEIEEAPADDRGDDRLEGLMNRAGITQRELGEYLGCTQQFLSKVATGKRKWPQGMRKGGGIPERENGG